jgi:hypothetical protein
MNDDFLYGLRRQPPTAFSAELRDRLNRVEPPARTSSRGFTVALKAVAAVALVALALSVPAVRASAQSFLAMFRADTLVGVPVDERRAVDLTRRVDLEGLLGGSVKVLQAPGQPTEFSDPSAASASAGFDLHLPASLPSGASITHTSVTGPARLQVTADTAALRVAMDALSIDDLTIPAGLEGQVVTLDISPIVSVRYSVEDADRTTIEMLQALSPAVALPAGVDMAALGEIALRVLGLGPADARSIAQAIDWHTTLLVPIPPMAQSFRQVRVGGGNGLFIEKRPDYDGAATSKVLLWSDAGRAYGIMTRGHVTADQLVAIADSVQ